MAGLCSLTAAFSSSMLNVAPGFACSWITSPAATHRQGLVDVVLAVGETWPSTRATGGSVYTPTHVCPLLPHHAPNKPCPQSKYHCQCQAPSLLLPASGCCTQMKPYFTPHLPIGPTFVAFSQVSHSFAPDAVHAHNDFVTRLQQVGNNSLHA